MDVDPKFIPAIEAALGRNLHAVILKDARSAEEILGRLTKKKLGQAALFVPKLGASAHESGRKSLLKGALAWAIDKIVAPRAVEPVIRQFLSGVLIFAKLDQALACKKDEPTLAMATLDGEFVSVEGIVFGGSSTVKSDSLLERKMRVAALEREEGARTEEEKTLETLNDLRLAIATERQRHESLEAQRQPMAARETELVELIAARRADIASYESKLAAQAQESRDAEVAIKAQTAFAADAEAAANKIWSQRSTRLGAVQQRETELRAVRNSLSELQEKRGHQQVRESQLQMQIENLAENISRRYQVDLRAFRPDEGEFGKTLRAQLKRAEKDVASTAEADLAENELQKLIVDLTRQLDNMGPVNLDAVQEYDELEERYKFLETQNTDLTNSRRELLDVISRINSTTQKLFAETFAQVRANFREMFAELFGGGRADLSLLDENDPLNCGIEISAKPPGKQLQSISLLSGGERAMTAVALLFAIYMVRPSPFCVLDEIDAPLDESNINRFVRMLDRFIAQSQFVIITHNKRTISKADVLYGVTMEERGVSKLVGMKLTAPPAGEQTPPQREPVSSQRQFALAENGDGEKKQSAGSRR